jgi:hypothetical protein
MRGRKEKNRRDNERFLNFTTARQDSSIDKGEKKRLITLLLFLGKSDLTFFESPLHNPTTTKSTAARALFNVLSAWSEVVYVV